MNFTVRPGTRPNASPRMSVVRGKSYPQIEIFGDSNIRSMGEFTYGFDAARDESEIENSLGPR